MSNFTFEFVDAPPPPSSRVDMLNAFADALRDRPGEWAIYPRPSSNRESARATAKNIRYGVLKAFPKGQFDARESEGVVYVSHIGGAA